MIKQMEEQRHTQGGESLYYRIWLSEFLIDNFSNLMEIIIYVFGDLFSRPARFEYGRE